MPKQTAALAFRPQVGLRSTSPRSVNHICAVIDLFPPPEAEEETNHDGTDA
jgi:hypothetical protein